MARLTAAARRALPDSDFAGPGRTFPIPDRAHAVAAQMLKGNAPASARGRIQAAANKKLRRHTTGDVARQLAGK